MNIPTQITFRNIDHSQTAAVFIEAEAEKLDKFFDRITSCRVLVEAGHPHHGRGDAFHVRIELGVPGKELVVRREPALRENQVRGDGHVGGVPHVDIFAAIRDAFGMMRRQLQDYVHCLRHEVKTHEQHA